jgi:hypothetical protein
MNKASGDTEEPAELVFVGPPKVNRIPLKHRVRWEKEPGGGEGRQDGEPNTKYWARQKSGCRMERKLTRCSEPAG